MKKILKKYFFTNSIIENILIFLAQKISSKFELFYPSNLHYKMNTIRCVEREGVKYELDISDYQAYIIYFKLKSDNSKILLNFTGKIKDGNVIDVGANIGQTSLWLAQSLPKKANIFAFEPFINTFQKLEINIELNNYTNIKIENLAIGSSLSTVRMKNTIETNSGGKHIISEITDGANLISFQQTTLDHYFENNATKIQLIKVDVEGYELEVLKGALKIIQKDHPMLFIEINDNHLKRQNSSAQKLIEFLNQYQYTIQNAETLETIDKDYNFTNCHFDIICK